MNATAASGLVASFQALIPSDYLLPNQGCFWQLSEEDEQAGHTHFQIAGGRSVAFSLDKRGFNLFPFFSTQLTGVRQVNDGLLVSDVDGQTYIVAIEMKTSETAKKEALKQIESGRLFVNWVIQLLHFHGHCLYGTDQCVFFGIVSLKPRQQPRKGKTAGRSAELPAPETSPHGAYPVFVLRNHPRASIKDLVGHLPNKSTH